MLHRYVTIALIVICFCWAAELTRGNENKPATARPNFVFFITDDISPEDLGVYGSQSILTPNLDEIARGGLVFENAYLTISSCSPSRCSIITGRYPHNTGAPELHTSLPTDQTTFIERLREAGYHTVISGKNHMGKPDDLGFDVASDSKPSGSENWVKHLQDRPQDQPFFCWFASHDAHHPFTISDEAPIYAPESVVVPAMLFDGPETRRELAAYAHEVSRTDHYAREVMNELARQEIVDNTYFVYCSDNGRPFPRCKTYLYDSGVRTPLIITGPGVTPGRTNSLVSSIDFSATFLELAGIEKLDSIQGQSFVPILDDPQATTRDVVFCERNWHVFSNHERAVRWGKWLYIWNAWPEQHNVSGESAWFKFGAARELWEAAEAGQLSDAQMLLTKVPQPRELLFDVEADPDQLVNLATADASAPVLEQARELLERWREETGDSVPQSPTPDRRGLHEPIEKDHPRGDFPGAKRGASTINAPGPIRID